MIEVVCTNEQNMQLNLDMKFSITTIIPELHFKL